MSSPSRRLGRFLAVSSVLLAGCGADARDSNPSGGGSGAFTINVEAVPQATSVRNWKPVVLKKQFSVPNTEYANLFSPGDLRVDGDGYLYVCDYADLKVKRFDPDGRFLVEYGLGAGAAPGELGAIMDIGVYEGQVFVVDDRNRRITFFDKETGEHVGETSMPDDRVVLRQSVTNLGNIYALVRRQEYLFVREEDGQVVKFGELVDDQASNSQILNGRIAAHGDDLIYAPSYFPRLMRFAQGGELVYSRGTIDGAFASDPFVEVRRTQTSIARRPRGYLIDGHVMVEDDLAFVHSRVDTTRTWAALDAYDASTGDYRWSIKIPEFAGYVYKQGSRIYSLTDTLVTAFEITE